MKYYLKLFMITISTLAIVSCSNDDDGGPNFNPTGESETYNLMSVADPSISGTATFIENDNGSTTIELQLSGTPDGGMHPAHIHFNTAAEGGDIAVTLGTVDGDTGFSTITVSELDDESSISYEDLLDFDGYINVHLSASELGTIVAQGDIGQNELTGVTKMYDLDEVAVPGINGTATFSQRVNGEALATLQLSGTPDGGMHPAHIHMNTAAETGVVIFTFNPVDGTTGMSKTNVSSLNDDSPFVYEDVLNVDGYINVHLSSDDIDTIVAQGDIGQNELTSEQTVYDLGSVAVDGISGTATFTERVNGEALAVLELMGTPDGGMHPAHIHMNTAAEGGVVVFTFDPVDGTTGMSKTNVSSLNDDSPFVYDDVLDVDGYINVHLSADDIETIVAQGDIGQNDLTAEQTVYDLGSVAVDGISGTATFTERINGEALVVLELMGTPDGGMHPAHIHMNTAAEGGSILFTFNPVNGTTGMSMTNVSSLDDDTAFLYDDVLDVDGYINVHLSAENLGTLVAQGDIGQNVLTGDSQSYALASVAVPTISGNLLVEKRMNGEALATITLDGTPDGGMHPAHIHAGSVADAPGGILFTFNPVDGTSGVSKTNITELDDMSDFGYDDVLAVDGYVNVHLSAADLSTLVAQGNIGANN